MPLLISIERIRGRHEKNSPFLRLREWAGKNFALSVLLFWLLSGAFETSVARAQSVSQEYPLKAIFLLNFAKLTDWPTNVFADPAAPFVIGVLGDNPFGDALDEAVRNENWNGHKIIIQHSRSLAELQNCHVLYISDSEARQLPKIIAALKEKPTLTVSGIDSKASADIGIQFITENNKIHFRINTDTLKNASLVVSSKLLRVAEIVTAQNK